LAFSGYGSGIAVFASGLVVAFLGFYASNIYNKQQQQAEEARKNQSVELEEKKFQAQKEIEEKKYQAQKKIEELKFNYEQQKWREALASQLALKHAETRLTKYT
jgi:flavodoxin